MHDFHAGDLLEIHGVDPAINFSAVHVTSYPAMTLVDIGQDHIKLLGVDHVSASDFLFHVSLRTRAARGNRRSAAPLLNRAPWFSQRDGSGSSRSSG